MNSLFKSISRGMLLLMRFLIIMCLVLGAAPLSAQYNRPKVSKSKPAVAPASEPISITAKEMIAPKDKILEEAKTLTATTETVRDTSTYARQHEAYLKLLTNVKTTEWPEDEQAILAGVPKPSAQAIKLLEQEKQDADARQRQKINSIQEDFAVKSEQRRKEEQQQELQKSNETRKQQSKQRFDGVFSDLINRKLDGTDTY